MNEKHALTISEEEIVRKIYLVRGKKIMLDKDLAELYKVKAFRLREQVKRNIERFPENFMFRLTEQETNFMVSQNAIPSRSQTVRNSNEYRLNYSLRRACAFYDFFIFYFPKSSNVSLKRNKNRIALFLTWRIHWIVKLAQIL